MKIQEMLETITRVEKERNVNVYLRYDMDTGWAFEMWGKFKGDDISLTHVVPSNQIAIWDVSILECFLHRMASDIDIGVIC